MSQNNSSVIDNTNHRKFKAIPPFTLKRARYDRVKVAESKHCGLGVFAESSYQKGHAIGRALGELKPKGFRSDYCVEFGDATLEPYAPYRFLNHSCDPNCLFIEWTIDDYENENGAPVLELWVHALKDILPGEELTIDYGWDWQAAIPCRCGSPLCRGWICRPEELELCRINKATTVNNK